VCCNIDKVSRAAGSDVPDLISWGCQVHGLRNIGERTASGLAPITAGSAADGPTNSEASALEEENFSLTRQVAALQYELDQMSSTGTQDQPDAFSEVCRAVALQFDLLIVRISSC